MAIEQRGDCRYYYRKRKVRGRVISEYLGAGALAERIAALDSAERAERQAQRDAYTTEWAQLAAADQVFAELDAAIGTLTRAALVVNGFHQHKRQWRKRCERSDHYAVFH